MTTYTAVVNVNRPGFQALGVHGVVHVDDCSHLSQYDRKDDLIIFGIGSIDDARSVVVDAEDEELGYSPQDHVQIARCAR